MIITFEFLNQFNKTHSTVTNQIAFDQCDFHSTSEFECMMDCHCQALVSKLETLYIMTFI